MLQTSGDLQNQLQRSSDAAPTVNAALVGPTLIGQRCWVRWPYLQEAIVEGVSDNTEKVRLQHALRSTYNAICPAVAPRVHACHCLMHASGLYVCCDDVEAMTVLQVNNGQGSVRHTGETREEWNRAVSKIGRDFLIKEACFYITLLPFIVIAPLPTILSMHPCGVAGHNHPVEEVSTSPSLIACV